MSGSLNCFTPHCTPSARWSEIGHLLPLRRSLGLYFQSLMPKGCMGQVGGLKSEMVTLCHHVLFLPTADIPNDHKTLFCCIRITSEFFSTQYAVIIRIGTHMKPMCHLFFRTNSVGFMLRKTVISINAL